MASSSHPRGYTHLQRDFSVPSSSCDETRRLQSASRTQGRVVMEYHGSSPRKNTHGTSKYLGISKRRWANISPRSRPRRTLPSTISGLQGLYCEYGLGTEVQESLEVDVDEFEGLSRSRGRRITEPRPAQLCQRFGVNLNFKLLRSLTGSLESFFSTTTHRIE